MGSRYEFECLGCAYAADVSGGKDHTGPVQTVTLSCLACRELMEIVIREPGPGGRELVRPARCRVDPAHRVSRWHSGGECPKCGKWMVRGSPVAPGR